MARSTRVCSSPCACAAPDPASKARVSRASVRRQTCHSGSSRIRGGRRLRNMGGDCDNSMLSCKVEVTSQPIVHLSTRHLVHAAHLPARSWRSSRVSARFCTDRCSALPAPTPAHSRPRPDRSAMADNDDILSGMGAGERSSAAPTRNILGHALPARRPLLRREQPNGGPAGEQPQHRHAAALPSPMFCSIRSGSTAHPALGSRHGRSPPPCAACAPAENHPDGRAGQRRCQRSMVGRAVSMPWGQTSTSIVPHHGAHSPRRGRGGSSRNRYAT